jgi:hypothetical protein
MDSLSDVTRLLFNECIITNRKKMNGEPQAKRMRMEEGNLNYEMRRCLERLHEEARLLSQKRMESNPLNAHYFLSGTANSGMGTHKVTPSRWNPLGLPYTPSLWDPTAGTMDDVFPDRRGEFAIVNVSHGLRILGPDDLHGHNPQEAARTVVD